MVRSSSARDVVRWPVPRRGVTLLVSGIAGREQAAVAMTTAIPNASTVSERVTSCPSERHDEPGRCAPELEAVEIEAERIRVGVRRAGGTQIANVAAHTWVVGEVADESAADVEAKNVLTSITARSPASARCGRTSPTIRRMTNS